MPWSLNDQLPNTSSLDDSDASTIEIELLNNRILWQNFSLQRLFWKPCLKCFYKVLRTNPPQLDTEMSVWGITAHQIFDGYGDLQKDIQEVTNSCDPNEYPDYLKVYLWTVRQILVAKGYLRENIETES